ncbi:MerR family transcriptional regulator [Novosphingobium sp.]|jgi:DNA-binding transcriptional MerR regulator|uniref:MerR family transcriptional regulator n=1 Tax=Novosphingobium sp. TaxID=1874826 RepID=UPI002FE01FA5
MLISQFAKTAGLSVDTVRFYIAKGLLKPERSARKGGANPYHVFSADDVTAAQMIRLQQSLGYSLAEIGALAEEYRRDAGSPERTGEVLRKQIVRLEERQRELDAALAFLKGKLEWMEAGQPGTAPQPNAYFC